MTAPEHDDGYDGPAMLTELSDLDLWGRARIAGWSTPPFPVPVEPADIEPSREQR